MIRSLLVFFIAFLSADMLWATNFINIQNDTTLSNNNKDSLKINEIETVTIIGERARYMTGSGQYISNRKLAMINQSNINNVLRTVPGVNIRDEEGFGLRPNIGLRGTAVNRSAKVTIMEDGILIAPAPYADPSAYYFPTFSRMQGIEVLKGSSQIKLGPYTIGGAVNLISTSIPDSFKGFAQLSYGRFGTNQQRFWAGDSHKNFDYVFEISRLASNGFKELDNGGNTGFDRRDIMGKMRWHTSDGTIIPQSVTLKFVQSSENGKESYLGLTYQDFIKNPLKRYAATQNDILEMKHNHIFLSHQIVPNKKISINTTAYYSKTFRDWARVNTIDGQSLNNILGNPTTHQTAYQIMTGKIDGNLDFQSAARSYHSQGIQSSALYFFNSGQINHKIKLGLRYHVDLADRYATRSGYNMTNGNMILATAGIKGNQENQIRNASSLATYLSYDFIYKGLKISPGVRYETIKFDIQNYGNNDNGRLGTALKSAQNDVSIILPGIGVNYEFNECMNVFGGIHQGFSPPGMPSVTSTSVQAKSETAISYELGYRFNSNGLIFQVTGFLNNYDNILGSDNVSGGGSGTGDLFNAGNAKINGLEFNLEYDLSFIKDNNSSFKVPVSVTYTYTNARFKETFINGGGDWGSSQINTNDLIPFITPHMLALSFGFENKKFNAMIMGRHVGATRTKPGQGTKILPGDNVLYNEINTIAGFFILDASANFILNHHFSLFSTFNNLSNNRSVITNLPNGFRPNIPLSFNLGLKFSF